YSIKEIEAFYRPRREGDVKNAGASIVAYEEWRQTGDAALLQAIERYNQDDCESTAQLHAWLRGIRPTDMPWRHGPEAVPIESDAADDPKAAARAQWLQERQALTAALSQNTPEDRRSWSAEHHLRELTLQLLDFHRRCDKPTWWKIFSCQDMTDQELIDDIECIGKLTVIDVIAPVRKNSQPIWVCAYPEQDFKTREGAQCMRVDTLATVTVVKVDEEQRRIHVKPSRSALEGPAQFSLTPPGPVDSKALRQAVERFATALAAGED